MYGFVGAFIILITQVMQAFAMIVGALLRWLFQLWLDRPTSSSSDENNSTQSASLIPKQTIWRILFIVSCAANTYDLLPYLTQAIISENFSFTPIFSIIITLQVIYFYGLMLAFFCWEQHKKLKVFSFLLILLVVGYSSIRLFFAWQSIEQNLTDLEIMGLNIFIEKLDTNYLIHLFTITGLFILPAFLILPRLFNLHSILYANNIEQNSITKYLTLTEDFQAQKQLLWRIGLMAICVFNTYSLLPFLDQTLSANDFVFDPIISILLVLQLIYCYGIIIALFCWTQNTAIQLFFFSLLFASIAHYIMSLLPQWQSIVLYLKDLSFKDSLKLILWAVQSPEFIKEFSTAMIYALPVIFVLPRLSALRSLAYVKTLNAPPTAIPQPPMQFLWLLLLVITCLSLSYYLYPFFIAMINSNIFDFSITMGIMVLLQIVYCLGTIVVLISWNNYKSIFILFFIFLSIGLAYALAQLLPTLQEIIVYLKTTTLEHYQALIQNTLQANYFNVMLNHSIIFILPAFFILLRLSALRTLYYAKK